MKPEPPHRLFFIASASFLVGVVLQSAGLGFFVSFVTSISAFAGFFYFGIEKKAAVLAMVLVLAGSFYYAVDDYGYHVATRQLPSGEVSFEGLVVEVPQSHENHQSFYLKTDFGRILVRTALYPKHHYGDKLSVFGEIKQPPRDYYGNYLAKERVVGTVFFPEIKAMSSGDGNFFMANINKAREKIRANFKSLFNRDQAALLSGMTLGVRDDFSEEFLESLSMSGTRHLTAISGLHMAIVIFLFFSIFSSFLPRKYAFFATFFFIFIFVAMTGFKVSAIRASVMGFVGGLAGQLGRRSARYNVLALAALLLVLANPKTLFFDVGFQLSFLAVVSIIYFMPVLKELFRFGDTPGFLGWKEAFLVTTSAQLAVAPILATHFQGFSAVSLVANVLVLSFIPVVLSAGFIIGIFSFIFFQLSFLVSLITVPVVEYIIFIVEVFAKLSFSLSPAINLFALLLYYGFFVFLCYRHYFSRQKTVK